MNDLPPVNVNVSQPEPAFQITLREVYNEVRTVSGKIDSLNTLPLEVADHEKRLRRQEFNETRYVTTAQARWWFTAVVALIVAATGLVALVVH